MPDSHLQNKDPNKGSIDYRDRGIYKPKTDPVEDYVTHHHYHGKIIRELFIAAAIIMIIALPVFKSHINFPISVSVLAILLLALFAGFTNPLQKSTAIFDLLASVMGFFVFELYALIKNGGFMNPFFLTNQLLAVIFFIALYFAAKTFRGFWGAK